VEEKHLAVLRRHMVEVVAIHAELASDVLGKTILDERVVAAMGRVPRHAFVPAPLLRYAYDDMPLPIGFDKTISQPFMVAVMTDLLEPRPEELVLEVGTALGYQAAILAELGGRVWSIEIVEELATEAEERLLRLSYTNIGIRLATVARAGLSTRRSTRSS
jgi:protein-L-isoaspartate(D-aspartate) O-methyltransferase